MQFLAQPTRYLFFTGKGGVGKTAIEGVPGLAAMNIDPAAEAAAYRERTIGPLRGVLGPVAD